MDLEVAFSADEINKAFDEADKKLPRHHDGKKRRIRIKGEIPSKLSHGSFIKIAGTVYATFPAECATSLNAYNTGILGEGSFGVVRLAMDRNQNWYALKVGYQQPSDNELDEAKISYDLGLAINKSPFIRMRHSYKEHKDRRWLKKYYVVQRYMGTDLFSHMQLTRGMPDNKRISLAIKICDQVKKLHSGELSKKGKGYAHRDLKPENITIDSDGEVHLIDYGFATSSVDHQPKDKAGTALYQPTTEYGNYTHKQLDELALKRVLFLSKNDIEDVLRSKGYPAEKLEKKVETEYKFFRKTSILTLDMLNKYDLNTILSTDFSKKDTSIDDLILKLEHAYKKSINPLINPVNDIESIIAKIDNTFLYRTVDGNTYFQEICQQDIKIAAKMLCHLDARVVEKIFAAGNPLKLVKNINIVSSVASLYQDSLLIGLIRAESPFADIIIFDPVYAGDLGHPVVVDYLNKRPSIKSSLGCQVNISVDQATQSQPVKGEDLSTNILQEAEDANLDGKMINDIESQVRKIKESKQQHPFVKLFNRIGRASYRQKIIDVLNQGQICQQMASSQPKLLLSTLHALSNQVSQLNWPQAFDYPSQPNSDYLKIALLNPYAQIKHHEDGIFIRFDSTQSNGPLKVTNEQLSEIDQDPQFMTILGTILKLDIPAKSMHQSSGPLMVNESLPMTSQEFENVEKTVEKENRNDKNPGLSRNEDLLLSSCSSVLTATSDSTTDSNEDITSSSPTK
jgi:serine/threonine protein kinase